MAYTVVLAAGTAALDGTTVDATNGRLPLAFQVTGAALTAAEVITIQSQNLTGTWLPIATLTATVQRVIIQPPGIFRASRGILTTSSGAEFDTAPTV